MANKGLLETWVDVPALLECAYGKVEGSIKYGIRKPMAQGNLPLTRCSLNQPIKIEGENSAYWSVSTNNCIKVKLLTPKEITNKTIKGDGRDTESFIKYSITKK